MQEFGSQFCEYSQQRTPRIWKWNVFNRIPFLSSCCRYLENENKARCSIGQHYYYFLFNMIINEGYVRRYIKKLTMRYYFPSILLMSFLRGKTHGGGREREMEAEATQRHGIIYCNNLMVSTSESILGLCRKSSGRRLSAKTVAPIFFHTFYLNI